MSHDFISAWLLCQSYHICPVISRWDLSPVAWIAGGLGAFVEAIEYAGGGKGWEVANKTNGRFFHGILIHVVFHENLTLKQIYTSMENQHFTGNTHYFDWAIFNSYFDILT